MNLQQLETLGKAVAKQVALESKVDAISLVTFVAVNGEYEGLGGTIAYEGHEKTYRLNAWQVETLLSDPEPVAREFLQLYLRSQVRWFLFDRDEQGET